MAKKFKPATKTPQDISNEITKSGVKETLRGQRLSANESDQKDISISLMDVDEAVLYYFNNVIKPQVTQNNSIVVVPVQYSSPEQWKTVQKDGFLRDKNGKVMLPIITVMRTTMTKDRTVGNKLDGNNANLLQFFEVKYNKRNTYDRFSALNAVEDENPKQYVATAVPDYLKCTYKCIILTEYVEQSNKLIEAVEYASDSYWGDPKRFKFKSSIDSFNTAIEVNNGTDRGVKVEFSITVNGYIIPNTINAKLSKIPGYFTPSQITFTEEII